MVYEKNENIFLVNATNISVDSILCTHHDPK